MNTELENKPWCVIQTKSRFEKKVVELLVRNGIVVYLPLQKRMKVWSDRMKEVEEPLFSGYLFVQFKESERYTILNTSGVVRFVVFAGNYATISDKQITAIKKAISLDTTIEVADIDFRRGEEVIITSGPFKDNYAHVIRGANGRGKLLLRLESIGKEIVLEIGRTRVEALSQLIGI
jgi:transcription antitermination factor NusG